MPLNSQQAQAIIDGAEAKARTMGLAVVIEDMLKAPARGLAEQDLIQGQ